MEFIRTVTVQKQNTTSYIVTIPLPVAKALGLRHKQEVKVFTDANKIIYEVAANV
jgi:bifunctional DNA-binding transcriptional regulator/antitoxin component of YhaV-PrlF toxin-antitoxin module